MSSLGETHGVPDSLEFKPKTGKYDVKVYECTVCGERVSGTENAVEHDACHRAPRCPGCGRRQARPSLGTDYGRVDDCTCGVAFQAGGER